MFEKGLRGVKTEKKAGDRLRRFFEDLKGMCKIRYNKLSTTIILPIILIGILWAWFIYLDIRSDKPSLGFLNIAYSVIVAPFWEEIIFRGIFLGLTIRVFSRIALNKLRWRQNKAAMFAVYAWSLLFISIIFSLFHEGKVDVRYIGGIIFGVLYLADNKNLLPAMIAHAINNLLSLIVPYMV